MTQLVLSLFPGIGLLDMAFESEGFCVVRGPDLLWGGDIRRFHPPAGRFDGVIGGPPCQAFSSLAKLIRAQGRQPRWGNLIPEFERVVREADPDWFLMENVPSAPMAEVDGYEVTLSAVQDDWVGGLTIRRRHFTFGRKWDSAIGMMRIEQHALCCPWPTPAVTSSDGGASRKMFRPSLEEAQRLQGFPWAGPWQKP